MTDRCSHCGEDKDCVYHINWGWICEDCLEEIKGDGIDEKD